METTEKCELKNKAKLKSLSNVDMFFVVVNISLFSCILPTPF